MENVLKEMLRTLVVSGRELNDEQFGKAVRTIAKGYGVD